METGSTEQLLADRLAGFCIRQATADDLPRVLEMGERFVREGPYAKLFTVDDDVAGRLAVELLAKNKAHILLAAQDDYPIGVFAFLVFHHYYTGELTAGEMIWYVEPEQRRGGAGLRLLAAAEQQARKLGCAKMQLTAPTEQLGNLFKRCGGYQQIEVCYQRTL